MARCLQLAKLGHYTVGKNPMVGCVIVHDGQIIGEGYHQQYGGDHAEIEALNSIEEDDRKLLAESTLYVSLEPCSHHGKTPPCANRIVQEKIARVVIGCIDPNPEVSGNGVKLLQSNGITVTVGVLEEESKFLIRVFAKAQSEKIPYITLKWAQSKDLFLGKVNEQVWLSNEFSKILVHKLRSEHDAIMVGTDTILIDEPRLNNRLYYGPSPKRIILDRNLRIPSDNRIFSDGNSMFLYSSIQPPHLPEHIEWCKLSWESDDLKPLLEDLSQRGVSSIFVEGGQKLLNSFIKQNLWDEAWVIRTQKELLDGLKAPLAHGHLIKKKQLKEDEILHISRHL